MSVAWDGWRFVEEPVSTGSIGSELLRLTITPSEGKALFARLLSMPGLPELVVSTADLTQRIEKYAGAQRRDDHSGPDVAVPHQYARPEFQTAFVAPRDEIEAAVARAWQELLGFQQVGIHDNFFELGGHSLLAVRISFRIAQELGVELAAPMLFESPTVAELSERVRQLKGDESNAAAKIAKALDAVEQMSDEEIEKFLAG
jgi:acyl carrier protein